MKLYKYSGWYLLGTGSIHSLIGLILGWPLLLGMHGDGWWNTVEPGGQIDFARSAILWFLVVGITWIALGYLMQRWIDQTRQPLPASLGWILLAMGCAVAFVLPVSGAWLFLPQGLVILMAPRSHQEIVHCET